jgi:glycosyltransferase involved in cell wall biosynthesis
MELAPIILFTYNRPVHTQQTVSALLKNKLAADSDIIIFSDFPKTEQTVESVEQTRKYLKTITGFRSVKIVERNRNFGLANNVIDGVTKIVNQYGKIIVLEDDLLTSPYFLQYMNEALALYENEENVVCIHGYVYPVKQKLPDTFFLRGADCWGWATWKRGWDSFNPDSKQLLKQIKESSLSRRFNFNNTYSYTKMLKQQMEGKIDSWAVRWYASAFIQNKLTLYPGKSLIANIGLDGTGTHCKEEQDIVVTLSDKLIELQKIEVKENEQAYKAFAHFFLHEKYKKIKMIWKKLNNV